MDFMEKTPFNYYPENHNMHNYQKVIDISNDLVAAVEARDGCLMQKKINDLEQVYKDEFGDSLDSYDAYKAFVVMNLASARYFAHNNMFSLAHERYNDVAERMDGFLKYSPYNTEQKAEIKELFTELENIHKAIPERHQNIVVGRYDTNCCLCRTMPANKTGSHMVPNFIAHPSFSWDGKGKRFHEALNHDFLNNPERNCQFYGRDVPDWRFAIGKGKQKVTDEDIEQNVNQLEYDNEFCCHCEDRFGVLESAYSQFYNGQQKSINPRIAYLFWLSVLWRMSMGSMSIFMDMNDELPLRKLLDDNMLDTAKDIEGSDTNLGEWRYAIFRAEGLREGDKGIMGYRKECSPYVVMYNDLVMVFYHSNPTNDELQIGPITVVRDMLNDWRSPEKSTKVDRRWFWDVRDWFVESSYDYNDPAREEALRIIREKERSENRVIDNSYKSEAIKESRLKYGPQEKQFRIRKMERIFAAWLRKIGADEKGETYDPLKDEELFLQQRDFDMYYHDIAALSRNEEYHSIVPTFPFYEQAREAIPNKNDWTIQNSYVNPYAGVRRNDPCPCGSGKKFKQCHGKF